MFGLSDMTKYLGGGGGDNGLPSWMKYGALGLAGGIGGGGGSTAPQAQPPQGADTSGNPLSYQDAGHDALRQYMSSLEGMEDPEALLAQYMEGYETSPYAERQMDIGMNRVQAAGARGGMSGSGPEMIALQREAQGIVSGDQQKYLQNLFGIGDRYRSGVGQVSGMGQQAEQAQLLAQIEREKMAQQQRQFDVTNEGSFMKDLAGIAGAAASTAKYAGWI